MLMISIFSMKQPRGAEQRSTTRHAQSSWPVRYRMLLVLVCILCSAACVGDTDPRVSALQGHLQSQLQTKLQALQLEHSFPGATLGVAMPDGSSFGLAVGLADKSGVVMRTDHLLLAGSVGKTFAAAVALDLVSEGRLGLDQPVSNWLDSNEGYSRLPNAADITVRMLMNHTAGIPDNVADLEFLDAIFSAPDRVWKPWEMVSYVLDEKPNFPAGNDFHYTDTHFILLGMIIEAVTGALYYDELQKRVLEPFSLDVVPADRRRIKRLANGYPGTSVEAVLKGYGTDWDGTPSPAGASTQVLVDGEFVINPQFEFTGGGLASTAEALARWARLLYEGKYLSSSMIATMVGGTSEKGQNYGLGVYTAYDPELGQLYGHSGFMPGFRTQMTYFADHGFAVAFQTNTNEGTGLLGPPVAEIVATLANVILDGFLTN